jgi:hypothetical protein
MCVAFTSVILCLRRPLVQLEPRIDHAGRKDGEQTGQ